MKKIVIITYILIALFTGFKLVELKKTLDKKLEDLQPEPPYNLSDIFRPLVKKEFEFRKIFDTKEPTEEKLDKTGLVPGQDNIDELQDKDTILRLIGIISSDPGRFAVLKLVRKNKTSEIRKLYKNDHIIGYNVEHILKDSVSLSKNGDTVNLRMFKSNQE